jgi:hypothetical protein
LKAAELPAMTADGIAISQRVADNEHLRLGDPLDVTFTTTGTKRFTVQAIYGARELAGDFVLPIAAAPARLQLAAGLPDLPQARGRGERGGRPAGRRSRRCSTPTRPRS